MFPWNEHHFTVILCFLCTDIHVKWFHNFHFDPNIHNLETWQHKLTCSSHFPILSIKRLVSKQFFFQKKNIECMLEEAKYFDQICIYPILIRGLVKSVALYFQFEKKIRKISIFKWFWLTNYKNRATSASECK